MTTTTGTRHTTAMALYLAIKRAALVAPFESKNEWEGFHAGLATAKAKIVKWWELQLKDVLNMRSAAQWTAREAVDLTFGELLETLPSVSSHATFQHAAGRVKVANYADRLNQFADGMAKSRTTWELWGGGPMPEGAAKPKKAKSLWNAKLITAFKEAMQDGDKATAAAYAFEHLGAIAYQHRAGKPFLMIAPQRIDGMPERIHCAASESGYWVAFDIVSGQSVNSGKGGRSRAACEKMAQEWYAMAGVAEKIAAALANLPAHDTEAAKLAWLDLHRVDMHTDAPEAQPAPEEVPASDTQADTNQATTEATSTHAEEVPADAAVAALVADAIACAAIATAQQSAADAVAVAADNTDTQAEELATVATTEAEESTATAAQPATTACTPATACTATTTHASTGTPGAHTSTTTGHASTTATTGRAPGSAAHHGTTSGHGAASTGQRVAGKSGRWCATLHTGPDGLPGMTYTGPDGTTTSHTYNTGRERMAALQRMASAADAPQQAGPANAPAAPHTPTPDTPTPPQAGGSTAQPAPLAGGVPAASAADYTDPLKTSGTDYTHPLKTSGTDYTHPLKTSGRLSITITRIEGPSDECCKPQTVGSFEAADSLLANWSGTAPEHGGYDKCDFEITWPDGDTYTGRYDLKHWSIEQPSLARHMVDIADFNTGKGCPPHMSEAAYEGYMARLDSDLRQAYESTARRLNEAGIHTGKARPVSIDLRELVAMGMPVADLVGLGVCYCGDSSGNPENGAIVDAEDVPKAAQWGRIGLMGRQNPALQNQPDIRVTIQTETGHTYTAWHDDFSACNGARYKIDIKRHGAPYLAQLAAAVAMRNAQATAAKELQAKAHADQLARLAIEYAHLERKTDDTRGGGVFAARNIRTELKRRFPGVKFSVRSDYSSCNVNWTDGPTDAQVTEAISSFDIGASDPYTDYFYTVSTAFSELFGGVQYLFTNRSTSQEFTARVLADWWQKRGESANHTEPTAQDWINARGFFDWGTGDQWARESFSKHISSTAAPSPATPAAKATRKAKA